MWASLGTNVCSHAGRTDLAPSAGVTVDPRAATGFAREASAYARGRPPYHAGVIADVARELGVTPAATVLDLGAGTGKLTRRLMPLVGRTIAVEPSPAMLRALREELPGVDARPGTAEAIPVADGSVDAVFAGEAFHWFRTGPACREIARVLTPRGGLAVLWNDPLWSRAELPWLPEFHALLAPLRQAAGNRTAEEEAWAPELEATGLFAPLRAAAADYVQTLDVAGFVALVRSYSWVANLPDGERGELLARVRKMAGAAPALRLRYRTEVRWARRA
jgi:SAM-dependent methyltransferase